jgi:hypothetical protein
MVELFPNYFVCWTFARFGPGHGRLPLSENASRETPHRIQASVLKSKKWPLSLLGRPVERMVCFLQKECLFYIRSDQFVKGRADAQS